MASVTAPVAEFLGRLTRLDPAALVRIRGAELWASVPWGVLVTRTVPGLAVSRTVSAAAWLDQLARLRGDLRSSLRCDAQSPVAELAHAGDPSELPGLDDRWRTGLPPATATVVETIPAAVFRQLGAAAATTLRETAAGGLNGRAVGSRAIRDALLDHVPIVVTTGDGADQIRVPQRLVQAVARMGFLGADDDPTDVLTAGRWIGISTGEGAAWWRAASALALHPYRA